MTWTTLNSYTVEHVLCGAPRTVTVVVSSAPDDTPWDGDEPLGDDYGVYVLRVKVLYGHLEASEYLGGTAAKDDADLMASVESHGMVREALAALDRVVAETLESLDH